MERYYSLSRYLKNTYGERLYKLALNGGMTCPNRDGTLSDKGCIFCSAGGSGEFAASAQLSVSEQLVYARRLIAAKYPSGRFIAYFQAYTNTYAPVSYLERIFNEALDDPDVAVLSVATRPDCLPDDVLKLLDRLNRRKPVWIELGLQTVRDDTAERIGRGYPLSCFTQAAARLAGIGIPVIAHLILGLPDERVEDMTAGADYLSALGVSGVKLQLLHILKGTGLESVYYESLKTGSQRFALLEKDAYVDAVIRCLEHLRPDIVIHRLTGDGPGNLLIAPDWSRNKRGVLGEIGRQLKLRDTWQGRCLQPDPKRNHNITTGTEELYAAGIPYA